MAIVTKPSNIYQEYSNVYQLSSSELLLHPKVSIDPYFSDQLNWKTVFLVYEAPNSNQREMVEFATSEGASTGTFKVTEYSRSSYQVKALIIEDFDSGYLRLEREDIDFTSLDISELLFPPPETGVPTLDVVSITPPTADANNNDIITLTFLSNEPLTNVSATIAGQAANVSGAGTSWTATYMLMGTEPEGLVTFSIDFQDEQNEQGVTATSTTDNTTSTIEYSQVGLSTVNISSTAGTTVKSGDVVLLSIFSENTIQNLVVNILGNTAIVSNEGVNYWEATYTLQSSDPQGPVTFTIDYEDQNSNPQFQVTSVTDGSSLTVDQVPTLNPVTISSDNATDSSIAEVGDTVTIQFTSSEPLQNVDVFIDSISPDTLTSTGQNYTATYVIQEGLLPTGLILFEILFQDLTGNNGTTVTSTTDGSEVTIQQQTGLVNSITAPITKISSDGNYITWIEPTSYGSGGPLLQRTGNILFSEIDQLTKQLTVIDETGWSEPTLSWIEDNQVDSATQINVQVYGDFVVFYTSGAVSTAVMNIYKIDHTQKTITRVQQSIQNSSSSFLHSNYIFERNPGVIKVHKIHTSGFLIQNVATIPILDNSSAAKFSVSGNTLIVGEPQLISNGADTFGTIYTYSIDTVTDTFTLTGTLTSPIPINPSEQGGTPQFGLSIKSDGDYVIVGDQNIDGSSGSITDAGQVYLYKINHVTNTISYIDTINSPVESEGFRFGERMDIRDNTIIISEISYKGSTGLLTNAGQAHIYKIDPLTDTVSYNTTLYSPNETDNGFFGVFIVVIDKDYVVITEQGKIHLFKI